MSDDTLDILRHIPFDKLVKWEALSPDMHVVDQLSIEDISRIALNIENDDDMYHLCKVLGNWHGYVVSNRLTDLPIGFCILEIKSKQNIVIFHGARVPDNGNILLAFRSASLMLATLLKLGYNVRTTNEYDAAFRFMSALGFISYKQKELCHWMYLSTKQFDDSKIVKRLNMTIL